MSGPSLWSWLLDLSVLPIYGLWLVGIVVALARRGRHPQVSAIVAASLAGLLLVNVGTRIGSSMIISAARSDGQPLASIGVYLGILGVAASLLRAGAWIALLIALFGWRQTTPATGLPAFQFSIRGLMILTLAVALLCGLVRGLLYWLGESAVFLLNLVDEIPIVICWVCGLRVALLRWKAHPQVSKFAVLGISISLAVLVFWQLFWMARVVTQSFSSIQLLSLPLTLVATVGWALVLIAVFGWREAAAPPQAGEVLGAGRSAGGVPS